MNSLRAYGFAFAGAAVVISLVVGLRGKDGESYTPKEATNTAAFRIVAVSFTHGTNHAIDRAGRIGSWVDLALRGARLRNAGAPSVRQMMATKQDTSVLWLSYAHSNTLTGTGPPYVAALLTRPDGVTDLIEATRHMSDPLSNGYLSGWTLPGRATNYSGWWFHVVTRPDGERVMSFKL